MRLSILSFISLIYLFYTQSSKEQNLNESTCKSEKENILKKEKKMYMNYQYKVNAFSVTNIQALQIIGILEQFRPNNIIEYGTGITTDIFEFYCEKYNKNLLTIEHSTKYQRESSVMFKLNFKGNVVIKDVKYKNTNIYEGLEDFFKSYKKKFDFVLIDAPHGEKKTYKYGRLQMIDLLVFDLLEDEGYFLIHNTEKPSVKNSLEVLLTLFKQKHYKIKMEVLGYKKFKQMTIINFIKQ